MFYDEIVKAVRESDGNVFNCEMKDGSEMHILLGVFEDEFYPVPVYYGTNEVLPWYIAREIATIRCIG